MAISQVRMQIRDTIRENPGITACELKRIHADIPPATVMKHLLRMTDNTMRRNLIDLYDVSDPDAQDLINSLEESRSHLIKVRDILDGLARNEIFESMNEEEI